MIEGRSGEVVAEQNGGVGRLSAIAEVVAVGAAYIAISIAAVTSIDASFAFPEAWTAAQRDVGSGFMVGAVVQILLVLTGAYLLGLVDLRRAFSATVARSTGKAWTIAVVATAIHITTAVMIVIPQPARVWEVSSVNLLLSAVPAADGWTQEVLFRGYVLVRLARGGVPAIGQILVSGTLFAAIHVGYVGQGTWEAISPLVGTFMLGSFYAWAVQVGQGSLKPVVICHIVIIIIVQPWLALAT